ncbi:MAG TPA: MFS transporter [Clostridia bacterium]|nr:MFS transporter [Clostridia bacterium]
MSRLLNLRESGKNLNPDIPLELQNNVTLIEYISICLARIGGVLITTLATISNTFIYECYYEQVASMTAEKLAHITFIQTTITTVLAYFVGAVVAIVAHKWKSRWGRYRQWYLICLVPVFVITVLNYVIPTSLDETGMIMFRYILAILSTIFTGFNNLGINIPQVISPNFKEKKTVATLWQIFYYLGYGGAYLYTFIYTAIYKNGTKQGMYLSCAIIAGIIAAIGNVMCALFCRERIELPKKEKIKLSGALFSLFQYKNYRSYYLMQWVNVLAMLGTMSTYLAAITVGSGNILLLTLPTAIGTVVGNLIYSKFQNRIEPTKMLKFTGIYSMLAATLIFIAVILTKEFGIVFFIFYFFFGIGVGFQELSTSHLTVEFNDYLEWETGERLEAIHGVVPTWITNVLNYVKSALIPYVIAWIGYEVSKEGDLVETMKNKPDYWRTCLWLLAFLVFGYALSNLFKAIILKFGYDIEGEKKAKMYEELEVIRKNRHEENLTIESQEI